MAGKTFTLLSRRAGQKASLSGATQIRAGVIRPELIIPTSVDSAATATPRGSGVSEERTGLMIGDEVRVIRDPLFGRIGQVVALPSDLSRVGTESLVRVLEVEFPDKTRAVIPRANVEIIEG